MSACGINAQSFYRMPTTRSTKPHEATRDKSVTNKNDQNFPLKQDSNHDECYSGHAFDSNRAASNDLASFPQRRQSPKPKVSAKRSRDKRLPRAAFFPRHGSSALFESCRPSSAQKDYAESVAARASP